MKIFNYETSVKRKYGGQRLGWYSKLECNNLTWTHRSTGRSRSWKRRDTISLAPARGNSALSSWTCSRILSSVFFCRLGLSKPSSWRILRNELILKRQLSEYSIFN
jgi:hypothetical protein